MTRRIDRHRHRPGWRQALGAFLACSLIVAPAWSATASSTSKFENDALGRLVKEIIEPGCSDLGNYSYNVGTTGCVRPHAVTQVAVTAGGTRQYTYDGNGNLTQENLYSANGAPLGGRSLTHTSFNMPARITATSAVADFYYGPEHQRVKQVSTRSGTTLYLNPDSNGGLLYEKDIKPDNSVEHRQFITAEGQVVAVIKQTSTGTTVSYLHRDHLGSTTAVTNEAGTVVESLAYEPFGKRRVPDGRDDPAGLGDPASNLVALTTERGFTNHEHLDKLGLIHMNGRIYDPLLGRFVSADPTTPNPLDLQSYNRYSYTRNNPLRMLDPSGFADGDPSWFESVASKVQHAVAGVKTTFGNIVSRAVDVTRGGEQAVQPEGKANKGSHATAGAIARAAGQEVVNFVDGGYGQRATQAAAKGDYSSALGNTVAGTLFATANVLSFGEAGAITNSVRALGSKLVAERAAAAATAVEVNAAKTAGGAADGAGQYLYHYTSPSNADKIMAKGFDTRYSSDGSLYFTNRGDLSPLQAQIELALVNRPPPGSLLRIDARALETAGISPFVGPRRVQGNLPGLGAGGGTEFLFNQNIPSQFIQRVK